MHGTAQTKANLSHAMEALSRDTNEVKTALSTISITISQTNLLALNTTIKAACVGEHKHEFTVVAEEARNLAERTQKSLAEINATIYEL